jgi:hypothetical protein
MGEGQVRGRHHLGGDPLAKLGLADVCNRGGYSPSSIVKSNISGAFGKIEAQQKVDGQLPVME